MGWNQSFDGDTVPADMKLLTIPWACMLFYFWEMKKMAPAFLSKYLVSGCLNRYDLDNRPHFDFEAKCKQHDPTSRNIWIPLN
jgi:hypothetical protein